MTLPKTLLLLPLLSVPAMVPGEDLYRATALTAPGQFTDGIEGPAVDETGHIFCVKFGSEHTLGKTSPDGIAELFLHLPAGSTANGIRFAPDGWMFVADYTGHNVLRVHPVSKALEIFAHEPRMNQPNDLTITADGTLYASDPDWKRQTGQLWRIDRDGSTHLVASGMGTTNGLGLSPDGRVLYVNESVQRHVWAFEVRADGSLANKRLIKTFPDHGFDGMRVDVMGRLHITRHGKGTVVIMSPTGEILQEVDVLGSKPSNLCFGGPDGRTVYVTEMEHGRLVKFRVEHPGLEWQRQQEWRLKRP